MDTYAWRLLAQIVVLLAGALVAGAVLARLRQSPLLGYILAGMVLGGPGSVRVIDSPDGLGVIAEIGVSLLLFSLGLEFSWPRLRSFGARIAMTGVAQVVGTAAVAAVVAAALGLGRNAAIAVGAMLSLSSTAAVLRVLGDLGETDSLHGRGSLAILLVQDMAVVPLAVLMTLLTGTGTASDVAFDVGRVLLVGLTLVAALYLFLVKLAVRAFAALAGERNRELTVLLAVVAGLGSAWAAHFAGLSPALGAFVAGMFLGGSPFATQVRADVSALRTVLVTIFFAAAGMVADPVWIWDHALLVLGVSALILVGKAAVVAVTLRATGQSLGVAAATGLCLCQVGEFAFVLGGTAKDHGVIGGDTYMLVVSASIVSLFATPFLVGLAPRASAWIGRRTGASRARPDERAHGAAAPDAVVVGFGPAGQAVGRLLAERGVPTLVLDVNPAGVRLAESLGLSGHVGDALQHDVLEHASVGGAKWVIVTLPGRSAALGVLHNVRSLNPAAVVVARTRHRVHQDEYLAAGATVVVDDEAEVGRRLREELAERLGGAGGLGAPG